MTSLLVPSRDCHAIRWAAAPGKSIPRYPGEDQDREHPPTPAWALARQLKGWQAAFKEHQSPKDFPKPKTDLLEDMSKVLSGKSRQRLRPHVGK